MTCQKCKTEIPEESIFCLNCGSKQQSELSVVKPKSRGNGTGSIYKLPTGKWRVAVTLGYKSSGQRIYRTKSGFKTKKEAIECISTLRDDRQNIKDIKFDKLYAEWSAQHYPNISKSKQTAYKIAYNKCDRINFMKIAEIRTKDLQGIVDNASGGYYPKHDIRVLCNLMFKYAMQNDYIVKNYAQFVKLPPKKKSTRDAFSVEETAALWDDYNAGNDFTGYILILIYTGMRLGELQIMQKDHIFLDENYMIGGIKTEAGIDREIIISEKLKPIVQKFYNDNDVKLLEMPEMKFYENYYAALKRAKTRRLTPHCCRHTFSTRLAEKNVAPAIIKDLAGHEDYSTTLQYTHISLSQKLENINKL